MNECIEERKGKRGLKRGNVGKLLKKKRGKEGKRGLKRGKKRRRGV